MNNSTTASQKVGPTWGLEYKNKNGGGVLEMLYVVLVYVHLEDKRFRFNNPCIGVLLRPDLVLTTQSCVEVAVHGVIDTELITVFVRNSQVLRSMRVFVYPYMNGPPNVVLIKCETSKVHEFPKLPEKEFKLNDLEYCTLCGFGTDQDNIRMGDFTSMRINRSEMEICNNFEKRKEWLCLHFTEYMPCRGDVGAPLVCGGAISAIFNPPVEPWSPPTCLDTYDATFTPLHSIVPWIQMVNNSLDVPALAALNTPWTRIATAATGLTIIVIIYCVVMKIVNWRCSQLEDEERANAYQIDNESRIILTKSSSCMSRITERWLFPHKDYNPEYVGQK